MATHSLPLFDREVPTEGLAGTEHHYYDSSPVALTDMVINSDRMPSQLPPMSVQMDGLAVGPI